jgi:hypothetical protein
MTCEESRLLMTDYWSKTLDESKELAFDTHLSTCPQCRAETERLGSLWSSLALLPSVSTEFEPGPNLRTRFYDTLGGFQHGLASAPKPRFRDRLFALWPKQPAWQMAMSFALLAIGIGVGYVLHPGESKTPATPEIAQLHEEVANMRQMVALSLMQQQSASERLRGVSYAYQVPPSDTQTLTALLATVNTDPNVGVRLAAVDALREFGTSPVTRTALIQAIRKQDAPLVQIALLDLLVDLKAKEAVPELTRLAADEKADASVRQHAKWALERLA